MTTATEVPETGLADAIELDDHESRELRALAWELAHVSPGLLDDPGWMAIARERSCHLPAALLKALRCFRADPGSAGVLLVHGLPAETSRSTPLEKESVERRTTVPASALVLCGMALGEIVAFRAEKSGAAVQNVVPVPGSESVQSNAGSQLLKMHVENAFHPNRPDFVALSCLRKDHDEDAGLKVACITRALQLVPAEHRRILGEPRFRTDPPPSFHGAGRGTAHAVLAGAWEDPDVRVDFASTVPLNKQAAAAMASLGDALESVCMTILLAPGDLAIVDNRVALHGRTAFSPRYDGHDRWLHRIFVHLDHRRSRGLRADGKHIID
jgi:L-asparagine oxygenase